MWVSGPGSIVMSSWPDRVGTGDEICIVLAEYRQIARRYRLLPHERLNAKRVIQYWYAPERRNPGWARERGPVEFTAVGAIQCWAIPGAVLVAAGIGLLLATGGAGVAYAVGYVGLGLLIVGILRGLPLLMAVRRFQATGDWRPAKGNNRPGPPQTPSKPVGGKD